MKKKMMMLLTTVSLIVGLTACGDSTASTNGSEDYAAPSLVVEGSSEATPTEAPAEVTPQATPEPTPEATPEPVYTELTPREWVSFYIDNVGTVDLVDNEIPNPELTLAELLFHIPKDYTVTWNDFVTHAESLPPFVSIDYTPENPESWRYIEDEVHTYGAWGGVYIDYAYSSEEFTLEWTMEDFENHFADVINNYSLTELQTIETFTLFRGGMSSKEELPIIEDYMLNVVPIIRGSISVSSMIPATQEQYEYIITNLDIVHE